MTGVPQIKQLDATCSHRCSRMQHVRITEGAPSRDILAAGYVLHPEPKFERVLEAGIAKRNAKRNVVDVVSNHSTLWTVFDYDLQTRSSDTVKEQPNSAVRAKDLPYNRRDPKQPEVAEKLQELCPAMLNNPENGEFESRYKHWETVRMARAEEAGPAKRNARQQESEHLKLGALVDQKELQEPMGTARDRECTRNGKENRRAHVSRASASELRLPETSPKGQASACGHAQQIAGETLQRSETL